uniref:Secreted protein n=1 Tax=Opuntia streptacantha TaxID=393608 RepID=A0A7C9DN90_OPUST
MQKACKVKITMMLPHTMYLLWLCRESMLSRACPINSDIFFYRLVQEDNTPQAYENSYLYSSQTIFLRAFPLCPPKLVTYTTNGSQSARIPKPKKTNLPPLHGIMKIST